MVTLQLDVLSDFFDNLDEWKKNWRQLTIENERQLYLLISQTMENVGKSSEAHGFLIKYLATFREEDNLGKERWKSEKLGFDRLSTSVYSTPLRYYQ